MGAVVVASRISAISVPPPAAALAFGGAALSIPQVWQLLPLDPQPGQFSRDPENIPKPGLPATFCPHRWGSHGRTGSPPYHLGPGRLGATLSGSQMQVAVGRMSFLPSDSQMCLGEKCAREGASISCPRPRVPDIGGGRAKG